MLGIINSHNPFNFQRTDKGNFLFILHTTHANTLLSINKSPLFLVGVH